MSLNQSSKYVVAKIQSAEGPCELQGAEWLTLVDAQTLRDSLAEANPDVLYFILEARDAAEGDVSVSPVPIPA